MFDCEITVKGDGRGKYGHFKSDKTGPVRQFMVDNINLYPIVKKHVISCPKCDARQALEYYLNRRKENSKSKNRTTTTLANLALSYERLSEYCVPRELVNEFIWRSEDINLILKHENRLSIREIFQAACLMQENPNPGFLGYAQRIIERSNNVKVETVFKLVTDHGVVKSEGLEELVKIAEVMIN